MAVPCCPVPFAHSHCPVPWCGPVAVGRDVPIAPHRPVAVHPTPRSLRPCPLPQYDAAALLRVRVTGRRCARRRPLKTLSVCYSPCPRALSHAHAHAHYPPRITRAARWSAAGPPDSRPTAITPAKFVIPTARGDSPLFVFLSIPSRRSLCPFVLKLPPPTHPLPICALRLPTAQRVPETKRASAHRWWTEARCRKDDWLA